MPNVDKKIYQNYNYHIAAVIEMLKEGYTSKQQMADELGGSVAHVRQIFRFLGESADNVLRWNVRCKLTSCIAQGARDKRELAKMLGVQQHLLAEVFDALPKSYARLLVYQMNQNKENNP